MKAFIITQSNCFDKVATPALPAEKSADDKINKIYEICDKVIDYYDDYKFGDDKTYKVYKLCESLVYARPMYDSYDPYDPYTHPTKTDKQ